ncbi:MAG: phosphatase PAP2 family protein [Proteobacteria bacterium]|nr:phosphatase PAP2 family protein [Pseudomonadota bacterium]
MKYVNRTTVAIAVIVFGLGVAGVAAEKAERQKFLPDGAVVAEALIPTPPTVGSPAFDAEMAAVLELQEMRSEEEVAFVSQPLDFDRFVPILEAELNSVDAEALKQTLDTAIDRVRLNYDAVKAQYNFPRPHQVSDQVQPVGEARPVASYPSGHTIRATVYARLLSEVFPEREPELRDFSNQIGYGRVVAGQHYPIDVNSGQVLGHAYADVIIQQPAFQSAITQIRGAGA